MDTLFVVFGSGVWDVATTTPLNSPPTSIRALTRMTTSAPTASVAPPQLTGRSLVHPAARVPAVTPRTFATWLGWRGSTCADLARERVDRRQRAVVAHPDDDGDHVTDGADARRHNRRDRQVRAARQRGREDEVGPRQRRGRAGREHRLRRHGRRLGRQGGSGAVG